MVDVVLWYEVARFEDHAARKFIMDMMIGKIFKLSQPSEVHRDEVKHS